MLFSEVVRSLAQEESLVADTNTYEDGLNNPYDYITLTTKSISLSEPKLIIIVFECLFRNATAYSLTFGGNIRCLLNNIPIAALGYRSASISSGSTRSWGYIQSVVQLPAGSHNFIFQGSMATGPSPSYGRGFCQVKNIYIGSTGFSDFKNITQQNSITVSNNTTQTVLSFAINAPSGRKTVIGGLKKAILYLMGTFSCEGYAGSKLKNPGESDENCLNWKLYINDIQAAWTARVDDYQTANQSYAEGASGRYDAPVDLGSQVSVRVDVTNLSGASRTVTAYMAALCSPWLLPTNEATIIELGFPQGSTLYIVSEPLLDNPTKTIKIGKTRATFGSFDFYTISGTGIINASYTFDLIPPDKVELRGTGFGGCISVIGVDVRA